MEEPVCEPPAVALYYVSRLARHFVKVLISGEGGDEGFAGYPNYRTTLWMERLKSVSKPLNGAFSGIAALLGRLLRSDSTARYAPLLDTPFESYYYSRTSGPLGFFNSHAKELYSKEFLHSVNKKNSVSPVMRYLQNQSQNDVLTKMLYTDTKTWLPDDLLIKADKITMANSIELRVPLLDHKVLEFAASLPSNFKVRRFTTKYIAKETLRQCVPREILERKKAGFPIPYASWLRKELRDWFHDVLLDRETLSRGYFEKVGIEHLLSENQRSGKYSKEIFSLAVLELWHREFLGKEKDPLPEPSLNSVGRP
jgi:asparagine synthase (glutamine-hydrolysing)